MVENFHITELYFCQLMTLPSLLPLAGGDHPSSSHDIGLPKFQENSFSTHEVSSIHNNPNCLKGETLFVPRACLLKGLHLILENSLEKSKSFDFGPDFSKVLQLSLHFSNISRHFRELVQIAMANVFENRTITNKHFQSPIFKKFFSRGNVLVQKQVGSSCYSLHEFNATESTNIEFCYSNAWKLHYYEKNTSFSPILQELVTHNCLCCLGIRCRGHTYMNRRKGSFI
ncbi:hypothetical protein RCL1_000081 [Eukaryota sp. TZLM3-RCL]